MTGELTDLDVAVINALSARYSHGGEAALTSQRVWQLGDVRRDTSRLIARERVAKSALCQKQTSPLFDHLVFDEQKVA